MTEPVPIAASSFINSASYDDATRTLTIEFGGEAKRFKNVPAEIVQALANAPSPGGFYHRHIKNRYAAA